MSIPKVAHWIWFDEELPDWAVDNIAIFRALHSDWTTRIWNRLPDDFPIELRAIIDGLPWYSSRSDIFRYWLLHQFGGIYLDTDVVTLRNFGDFVDCPFFMAPSLPEGHTQPHLNCAVLGGVPESQAMTATLTECIRWFQSGETPRRITYGPDLLTKLFQDGSHNVTLLPLHYFYAIPDRKTAHRFWHADSHERQLILETFRQSFSDSQEPYAAHLWGVENSSQRQVNFADSITSLN